MLEKKSIVMFACAAAVLGACLTEAKYPQRAAEVACAKLEECSPEGYTAECEETYEELLSATIDECDKYRGGLAHRCLDAVEEQGCDDFSTPSACAEFNERCGFDDAQSLGDLDLEATGLGQIRIVK